MKKLILLILIIPSLLFAGPLQQMHKKVIAGQSVAGGGITGEFDVAGATYYAVAPADYSYTTTQNTNYYTRKYTTIALAYAALDTSPSTPQIINILDDAGSESAGITLNGVSSTSSYYTIVRVVGGFTYTISGSTENMFRIQDEYLTIDGLKLTAAAYSGGTNRTGIAIDAITTSTITVRNCIIDMTAAESTGSCRGISLGDSDGTYYIYNNIVYGTTSGSSVGTGIFCDGGSGIYYLYNNTISTCDVGIDANGTVRAKNNVSISCNDGYKDSFHADSTNNASDVTDDAPATGRINLSSSTITDYFESATDYHIKTSATYASELIAAGADLDEDATIPITTDFEGDARSASTPDVGADED